MNAILALMMAAAASAAPAPAPSANSRASLTASVRIVRSAAWIGEAYGVPQTAQARETLVSAADGSPAPMIVYEFE